MNAFSVVLNSIYTRLERFSVSKIEMSISVAAVIMMVQNSLLSFTSVYQNLKICHFTFTWILEIRKLS